MSLRDPDSLLMGGGTPSCTFPTIGTTWKGTVLAKETQQQRDLKTGEAKTWSDGSPMEQVVITLQTDARDPERDGDDGQRKLYVKGGMLAAIREAVRRAGATTVEIGGTLAVRYSGDGVPSQRGFNPPKQYTAEYRPPEPAAGAGLI